MFENYKKQTEDESRSGRIALTVFLIILIGSLAYVFIMNNLGNAYNPQINHTFSMSDEPTAERLETLCESLPKPEKFDFISKSEPKNDYQSHLVIYTYTSKRAPEEILPAFYLWFNENGWRHVSNTETFRKDNFSIYISHMTNDSGTTYEIYCSEKQTPENRAVQ